MHYKPFKRGPGVLRDTGSQLPYRDPLAVERIVGRIRKAVQVGTAFWDWPICKAFPTWNQFHEQLAQERVDAEKEGREPHAAAAPPKLLAYQQKQIDDYGELIGTREAMGLGPQKYKKK